MSEIALHNTIPESQRREVFALRYITYFGAWLCTWQGASFSGSIFQLEFLALFPEMPLYESALMVGFVALILERWITKDYSLASSYFSAPMILIFASLVLSWIYGQYLLQTFRPVYEIHESILIPIGFIFYLNAFRDVRERKVIAWLFILGAMMKAADATWIKMASDLSAEKLWGALVMWRDGYILALGIIGAMILAHYHGNVHKRLRAYSIAIVPFLAYGLLVSYRRTFILGLILSSILLMFTLGRGKRLKQFRNFFIMLLVIIVFVLLTDPLGIIARMAGVFMPNEEGSSYIRLIEYPNILRNIADNPILGVPIGVEWHTYYYMPLFANRTSFGTHNTYLYWPLRTGIPGTIGFLWLLARAWKALLINWRLQRTQEDFFYNHFILYAFGLYNFGCFFGLMYSDAMGVLTGLLFIFLQLQMKESTGLESLKNVHFLKTLRQKKIVMRPKVGFTPRGAELARKLRERAAR